MLFVRKNSNAISKRAKRKSRPRAPSGKLRRDNGGGPGTNLGGALDRVTV